MLMQQCHAVKTFYIYRPTQERKLYGRRSVLGQRPQTSPLGTRRCVATTSCAQRDSPNTAPTLFIILR